MRDPLEFQEIEKMGEGPEPFSETAEKKGGGSVLPLFQAALCVLALLALVFFKCTDQETYDRVTDWYREEIVREIRLPRWSFGEAESDPPSVSEAPAEEPSSGFLQRI